MRHASSRWLEIATLIRKEALEVLRDRRAAFFTFVLPLLLYPVILFVLQKVESWGRRHADEPVRVGLEGEFGEFYARARSLESVRWVTGEKARRERLEVGSLDLHLEFIPAEESRGVQVVVSLDSTSGLSSSALARIRPELDSYRVHRLASLVSSWDPEHAPPPRLQAEMHDVSTDRQRGRVALGKILPPLLVLLLITGGAFVAIDVVAGEKERGTLETLLVHPVRVSSIAWSKFLLVLGCSVVSVVLNLIGMFFAFSLGLGPARGMFSGIQVPALDSLLILAALLVPLAVLTSSVLLLVSSRSSTFRQAQTFLFPTVILAVIPAFGAALPGVPLNLATAIVPVANVALVVREAVTGSLAAAPFAVALASTTLYASLAVFRATRSLGTEEMLLDGHSRRDSASGSIRGHRSARTAVIFSACMLLFLYYVAPLLQAPDGPLGVLTGLQVTLWGAVLIPAALYVLARRRRFHEAWALRAPGGRGDWVCALVLVPVTAILVTAYMSFQETWLPFSRELTEAFRAHFTFEGESALTILWIFAISPAICEELLWRGTVQGELEKRDQPFWTVVLVGLFFGMFHLSIHRLVPTAVFGALLAYIRLRTRSVYPGMVLHLGFNAIVIFLVAPAIEGDIFARHLLHHPATLLASLGVVYLALRRLSRPRPGAPGTSS